MLSFIVSEAFVDLRRAGRVGISAILLITLSLTALGGFWLLSLNLGRAVGQWRDRVKVVVFLKDEPTPAALTDLTRRVEDLEGVQRVRYVGKAEALSALRQSLGAQGGVVDHLPRNPLPASLEVTPAEGATTPEATRALAAKLAALPESEEVQGGAEWVEGLARWQRLFQVVGLAVGAVLALAAILTVTTATTLVLHVRRAETEIMRLVGASEAVVRLPQLLQGMVQGLLGAVVALALLEAAYAVGAPRLEPLLQLTLGLARAVFLSVPEILLLIAGGAVLGGLGGLLARGRVVA
jgi:cell division transport system permease protein